MQTELAEADANDKRATQDELRVEWGGDYRAHMNALDKNMLSGAPESVSAWLAGARGRTGRRFLVARR